MSKVTLREQKIAERNKLSCFKKRFWDWLIFRFVRCLFLQKQFKQKLIVAVYYSNKSEVSTQRIIRFLLKNKIRVCLPAIDENSQMVFREIKSLQFQNRQINGFTQPSNIYQTIDAKQIKLCIVPIVGYDNQHNRIGYGKGYYDRYLTNCPQIMTVGLAYSIQACASIPAEPHDIKLAKIITNKGIF